MNSVFIVSGGVKSACSKGFGCLKKSVLSWLNGRTVEQLNSSIFVKFFNISTIKLKNLFTTHYSQFTKKLFAFTLAETLIVMGVIGVVAALTLPNLNSSTGNKEKIAKVKKIYSNLNDAFGRATAVYGPYDEWFVNDANDTAKINRVGERLVEFMKVSKNCKMTKGCYTSGSGTSTTYTSGSGTSPSYEFITADGTAIAIQKDRVWIDIDGLNRGINTDGGDIFGFIIDDKGINIYPMNETAFIACIIGFKQNRIGVPAASWIINYDNMDYTKADIYGKCPNGKVLTYDTVTTCN